MQFLTLESTACFKERWLQSQGCVTASEQPKAKAWTVEFCGTSNCRALGKGRCKGRSHMRNQFGLQSVCRCLVRSACWEEQVFYYSQEKRRIWQKIQAWENQMNGGTSGGFTEMGWDPHVLFWEDKAYWWGRKGWTGKYWILRVVKGTCGHLLCVTVGENTGTFLTLKLLKT